MKLVSDFSYYIDIHKKTIVTTVCFSIIVACLTVIYIYTRTPTYPDELVAIDTLCDEKPQKAETMLKRFRSTHKKMNSDNEWYCRFLQLKSDVKLLKPLMNDKEASAILTHYESEDDSHMLPQVYYYVGCVYYMLGDSPQAIDYLHKGLSLSSDVNVSEKLCGLYYYMLGEILAYQHLDKEALAMSRKSLAVFEKYKNVRRIIYSCLSVSWSFKSTGDYDKSIYYLYKALNYAQKNKIEDSLSEIYNQLADRYFGLGKYSLAEKYIKQSLSQFDESNKSSIYNVAGQIYEALGNIKRAKFYYGELLKYGSLYGKQNAYNFFVRYYRNNKDLNNLYKSSLAYCAVTDSIVQITASEYSAKANAMYNYKFIEKEKQNIEINLERKNIIIYVSAIIAFIAIIFILYYGFRNKKRQRELSKMLLDANNRSEMVMAQHKIELAEIKKRLEEITSEKMNLYDDLRYKEIELEQLLHRNEVQNKISKSADSFFKDTKIYRDLNDICRHKVNVSSQTIDWTLLEKTLFDIYPTFRDGLIKFKRMKEQAYHVCLLIKSGFNVQEIAYLTMRTDEAINSTRRRLYESNFKRKGKPSEWDDVINSL